MDLVTLLLTCAPAVDPSTLAALVQAESNGHPYAIHDNHTGQSHWPKTQRAAVKLSEALYKQGHSLDVGLGQISTGNFERLGLNFEKAFEPCNNLAASAAILIADYQRTDPKHSIPTRLTQTLSRYNTGSPTRGVRNGYVARIVDAAQQPTIPPISVLETDRVHANPVIQNDSDVFDLVPDGFE